MKKDDGIGAESEENKYEESEGESSIKSETGFKYLQECPIGMEEESFIDNSLCSEGGVAVCNRCWTDVNKHQNKCFHCRKSLKAIKLIKNLLYKNQAEAYITYKKDTKKKEKSNPCKCSKHSNQGVVFCYECDKYLCPSCIVRTKHNSHQKIHIDIDGIQTKIELKQLKMNDLPTFSELLKKTIEDVSNFSSGTDEIKKESDRIIQEITNEIIKMTEEAVKKIEDIKSNLEYMKKDNIFNISKQGI